MHRYNLFNLHTWRFHNGIAPKTMNLKNIMGNCCKSQSLQQKKHKRSKLSISISIENEDAKEQNEEHECENNEKPEPEAQPEPEPQHGLLSFHFGHEAIGDGCHYA